MRTTLLARLGELGVEDDLRGREVDLLHEGGRFGGAELAVHRAVFPLDAEGAAVVDVVEGADDEFEVDLAAADGLEVPVTARLVEIDVAAEDAGVADNTFVMYSTDNGPHMNTWPDGAMTPFRNEKNSNWEGAYRVPAFIRWPGHFPAGLWLNGIVAHEAVVRQPADGHSLVISYSAAVIGNKLMLPKMSHDPLVDLQPIGRIGGGGGNTLIVNADVPVRNGVAEFSTAEGRVIVCRTGYTGEDGFEIVVPVAEVEALWNKLAAAGVRPCGLGARDTLRLEAGMNLYGHDMDETISPLAAGINGQALVIDGGELLS